MYVLIVLNYINNRQQQEMDLPLRGNLTIKWSLLGKAYL